MSSGGMALTSSGDSLGEASCHNNLLASQRCSFWVACVAVAIKHLAAGRSIAENRPPTLSKPCGVHRNAGDCGDSNGGGGGARGDGDGAVGRGRGDEIAHTEAWVKETAVG